MPDDDNTIELYKPFDELDKQKVKLWCVKRWKDVAKRFVFSFALPFVCADSIIGFINRIIAGHSGNRDNFDGFSMFKILLVVWIPVFIIIGIGNVVLFLKYIPAICIDMFRGKKRIIQFNASHYSLTEFNKYYIQTPIPRYPFFEVTYDDYCLVKECETLILETAPKTGKVLALKNGDGTKAINIIEP